MKKNIIFSITVVIFTAVSISFILFESKKNEIETLREKHQKYLLTHSYNKYMGLSKKERKDLRLSPNQYFEEQYILEMNPSTGRAENEKLIALQYSLMSGTRNVPGTWNLPWEERGPSNVPGRCRAVMYDPNDTQHKKVFAGGVSGGLWYKNDIASVSEFWTSADVPENLSVTCITADPINPQNMFLGTGESYVGDVNGDGIWRSTNGGTNWTNVFGGPNGATYFNGNTTLTVNLPVDIAGNYDGLKAQFGAQTLSSPITSDLVLVNDGTSAPTLGCSPLTNATEVSGKIAVIDRGTCLFVEKVKNAQNAGAVAVIMINNLYGTPLTMAGTDATITIPAIMISKTDGDLLKTKMATETVNTTIAFDTDTDPIGLIVPGSFHVNDIKARNNNGIVEIFASVSEGLESDNGAYLGSDNYGLYKSTDNGNSWAVVNLPLTSTGHKYQINDIEINPVDNTVWLTSTKSISFNEGGGRIFKSTDGINFSIEYTIPNCLRTELAISSINANKMFVLAENSATKVSIYKTLNGFQTAPTTMPKPDDPDTGIPADDFTRGQAFYDLMLAVDPNNDDIVYVGGVSSFRSADGGNTWQQMSKWTSGNGNPASVALVHADQHELIFDPTNSDKGIMVTDGGVFYATSFANAIIANSHIKPRKYGFNTTQFYKGAIGQNPNNTILLGGAQDNGSFIMAGANPGINLFSEVTGGDGMYCFFDKDGLYSITSNYGNIYYFNPFPAGAPALIVNENAGTFVNVAELDDNLDILFSNASTSSAVRISRFTNLNGTPVRTNLTNALLTFAPTAMKVSPFTQSSTTLLVGTLNGKLLKLTNANATPAWTDITGTGFAGSISSISFGATENDILVTFHNYGVQSIWYSNNGGTSWVSKEGNLPDLPIKDILMNPVKNEEVIIATNLGVWATNNFFDTAPNWFQTQNGMKNVKVTSFDLRTSDNTVLASTYGRGLFTGIFNTDILGFGSENTTVLNNELLVYPTVSNGNFNIKSLNNFGKKEFFIYDTNGKLVKKGTIELTTEINSTVSVKLKPGIYIIKIPINVNKTLSNKIIIQ